MSKQSKRDPEVTSTQFDTLHMSQVKVNKGEITNEQQRMILVFASFPEWFVKKVYELNVKDPVLRP